MMLDFFGTNVTDGYVENNYDYASDYIKVLNKNIQVRNGYVPLIRILYFYNEDESLSFDEIYEDNLDTELKLLKPISEVCEMDKYKNMDACSTESIEESDQIDEIQSKPFVLPLPLSEMTITSFFKQERTIYGSSSVHDAWDLAASNETPVYAVCDGEVLTVSFTYSKNVIDITDTLGGNYIELKCAIDEETTYIVKYAHLYPDSYTVSVGDTVSSGLQIASVGTTGYSTGPHLHFQVQLEDGTYVDGMSLIDFTEVNAEYYLDEYNQLLK